MSGAEAAVLSCNISEVVECASTTLFLVFKMLVTESMPE